MKTCIRDKILDLDSDILKKFGDLSSPINDW